MRSLLPCVTCAAVVGLVPIGLVPTSGQSISSTQLERAPGPYTAAAGDQLPTPKVLIIGIDGCRPDALIAAQTPNLDSLIETGGFSELAQTEDITSSGPGWSSMLTGVWRDKHGVDDNSFAGSNFAQYPHFFTRIRGLAPHKFLASIVHWSPINTQILSDEDFALTGLSDAQVAAQAAQLLSTGNPDVLFLHFDDVDGAGHGFGFSPAVPQYISTIETTDNHVGTVLSALRARPEYGAEDWMVIVSTDHGGLGTSHGGNTPEQRTIFFSASSRFGGRGSIGPPPGIVDVAATALVHLGLELDPAWNWDGVSVVDDIGCPSVLAARPDHAAKTVTLSWAAGAPNGATGWELFRDGQSIALLGLRQSSYTDTPPTPAADSHEVFEYTLAPVGGGCSGLSRRAVLSGGQVVFADDFEDYADDTALIISGGWKIFDIASPVENATWTLANIGGRGNPPEFDGRASRGGFLSSDSDAGGSGANSNTPGSGMSHDVWTPSFDCSLLSEVWLHAGCSAILNDNGDAVFDVDVSTDGGQSWINALRRISPSRSVAPFASTQTADGLFGRLDLDLTALAAGESTVRVRFRHFEPSWDWWIALDDIIVDDADLTQGGAATLLGPVGFGGGIPIGWTIDGLNGGTETWHTTDKGGRYTAGVVTTRGVNRLQHPAASPDFAIVDSDANPDPAENEALITPVLDCTTRARVFLHWSSEVLPDGSAVSEVLVSLDGGASFLPDPVFSHSAGGLIQGDQEPLFSEHTLLVPDAAGEATVAFAFRYQSPGNAWWWAIDNVRVSAD
jgi:hypothetical protein